MDIEFVARQIDINPLAVNVENYSKGTYARHQQLILLHFGYSEFNELAQAIVMNEIKKLVRVQYRPKLILLDVIQVLIRKKIAIPSYNTEVSQ